MSSITANDLPNPPTIGAKATTTAQPDRYRDRPEESAMTTTMPDNTRASARMLTQLPCQQEADLWFADSPADVELAKDLCAGCPARQPCLDGALHRREPCGVWGGELFIRGEIVARKRPRGRPRKDATAA